MKKAFTAILFLLAVTANAQAPQWRTFDSSNAALPTNIIISIAVDNNNTKWIGTFSGLVSSDGDTWTTYNTSNSGLPDNIVRGVAIDNSNNVWAATLNGLAKFDGTNWTIFYEDTTGINPTLFLCVVTDALGNVYAGTESNGLFWYNGTSWQQFTTQNSGIPQNRVESIGVKGIGNLWFGTNSAGLVNGDLNTGTFTSYTTQNSNLPFDFVKTVILGTDGKIWAGSGSELADSGLVSVDPQTAAIIVHDFATTGISFDKIWAITFDQNELYVGTNDSVFGFAKRDTAGWSTYEFISDGLVSNYVYCITVDDSSYKWIGTFNGISVYSEAGVFVGVDEQVAKPFSIKTYPQPATERVQFAVNSAEPQRLLVEIYSLEGNLMDKIQVNLSGKDVIAYNTTRLAQGLYVARFTGEKNAQAIKFIVTQE